MSTIDINGDLALWDLEPGKVEVRAPRRPGGTYRHYRIYYAPTDIGGGTIRVRFTSNQRDRDTKFNREENLRIHHDGSPAFIEHMGKRSNAESVNSNLKRELNADRAHSYGADRNYFDLLGFAIRRNIIALWEHDNRARQHAPPLAA